ncbi:MAG: exosortase W [Deltaproteobacteria bacterium]|nr:exosortase W [Deltaproteobacteria bacterium]
MSKAYDKTINAGPVSNPVFSRAMWGRIAVLGLAFALALRGPLALLADTWSYQDFSHGFIVPIVSLYIIWVERERLKEIPIRPSFLGGITVVAAGALALMTGRTASVVLVEESSLLVIIPGLVLLLLGRRYLKALALPLAYLVLMVPVFTPLIEKIHWPFQLFTARFASALLPHLGVPVYQRMQYLELPNISLEVAEACSGANFMVSIIAIVIPLAYFTQREWWRKSLLVVLAFFIGLLTNGLRVTLIGIWTYYNLGDALHGPYHLLQGYFVSIFGFIFLFFTAHLLKKLPPHYSENSLSGEPACPHSYTRADEKRFNSAMAAAIVMLSGLGLYYTFYSPAPLPLNKSLTEFPLAAGQWTGTATGFEKYDLRVPGASDELNNLYRNASGRSVRLYIGYLDSQTQYRKLIGVHFEDLYRNMTEVTVPDGSGGRMTVNRVVSKSGSGDFITLFWYNLNGRNTANRYKAKLITAADGLVTRHTNGALIIVTAGFKDDDDLKQAFSDDLDLIKELQPSLNGYFSR